jgi:hypothetical protein
VVEAGEAGRQGLTVPVDQPQAGLGLDRADARERHARASAGRQAVLAAGAVNSSS